MTSYFWKGTPDEETRQHYANVRIRDYQLAFAGQLTWAELLSAFRYAGRQYDEGTRLSHWLEGAA